MAALFIRQLYVMLPYVLDIADNELQDKALRITANQTKCDAKSFFLPVELFVAFYFSPKTANSCQNFMFRSMHSLALALDHIT